MKLIEIDKAEFDRLDNCEETYFCNGVIFDCMDNVIAFPEYTNEEFPKTYYKVKKE